jgi:sulfate transport system ATP-binding protein
MSLHLQEVSKHFGAFLALDRLDLDIPDGQLMALLGPSGSGKTTLLRILAGLEQPDSGQVRIQGGGRRIGFVFQHYALFKHMTVFENVAFGLRVRPRRQRPGRAELRERVQAMLEMVQLGWAGPRMPDQLSGGQRQRVALARALAVEPEVLLLDEPFGALDAQVRLELRRWLRKLHDRTGLTTVFVTHDQEEAMEVADRIVLLNHGVIEQDGSPQEIYETPASPFVYRFIGQVNQVGGRVLDGAFQVGAASIPVPPERVAEGMGATAYLRPHHLQVGLTAVPGSLPARVLRIQRIGPIGRVHLAVDHDGTELEAHLPQRDLDLLALRPGQAIHALPGRLDVFPGTAGEGPEWVI